MPEEEEKLTRTSTKARADPVTSSVNKDLQPAAPGSIFPHSVRWEQTLTLSEALYRDEGTRG